MLDYANADLNNLREALLDHPLYDNVASLADLIPAPAGADSKDVPDAGLM